MVTPKRSLPPSFDIPLGVTHTFEFLRHFTVFFILPIVTIVCCAYVSAVLARFLYLKLFARYATPQELLDGALIQLKKSEQSSKGGSRNSIASRDGALDALRLVIKLDPAKVFSNADDIMKPFIVLATELFYGEINNDMNGKNDSLRNRKASGNNTTRRRRGQTSQQQKESNNSTSPKLIECQDVIQKGLAIDPQNNSLLKLQNELGLIRQYGKTHITMLKAGHLYG